MRRSPVDLKVERADYHRKDIIRIVEDFRAPQAYTVSEDVREQTGVRYRVVSAKSAKELPDELPLILGDFIQNLRASLDYLVGAMRDDGPTRISAFPVYHSPDDFNRKGRPKLTGIPDDAKDIIESMQPYDATDDWRRDVYSWLHWLDALWSIDKHRTVLLAASITRPNYVGHNRSGEEPSGVGYRLSSPDNQAEWWLPLDGRDTTFDPHFAVHVALAQPRGFAEDWPSDIANWEVDAFVNYLYNGVKNDVLTRLRQFIKE